MKTLKRLSDSNIQRDSLSQSLWQESAALVEKLDFEQLDPNKIYDVVIVGGGITGLSTALLLQEAGLECVLTEAHTLGFGTTGGTTSHVNTMLDTSYDIIESDFGEKNASLVAASAMEAITLIYNNIRKYDIDCDFEFKDGYLFAQNDDEEKQLKKILEASQRAGVDVHETAKIPVPIDFHSAIVFKNQAQLDPLKYLYGLADAFTNLGGIIIENNKVQETKNKDDFHTVTCERIPLNASKIIYATHIPPGINILHFRCAPYRSYVLGARLESNYPQDLSYDMKDPYHYFRTHKVDGQDYLIIGGEDHKTGHNSPEESFKALEDYLYEHFNVLSVDFRWSSQFYESADGLPYIGALPAADKGIYTATGFSGNGVTFGTFSALLLTDLILGRNNPYSELYSPSRIKPIAGFVEFVKENTDVAYHFIADRMVIQEIESLVAMKPDTGLVVNYKKEKVAVYKDETGKIHALNPVCTHARCIVNWNHAEKSWDCPCHGGRFDKDGKVLTGPPRSDLQRVDTLSKGE